MLIATDYARKMALDMRMIDPSYEDHHIPAHEIRFIQEFQAELSKNEPKAVEKQDEHAPDIRQEPRPKGDTVPTVNVPMMDKRPQTGLHI